MAFILTDELNEIRIYDEKAGETQSLFARDPSPFVEHLHRHH